MKQGALIFDEQTDRYDIRCFHASVKSSLISLFLLSPQNHRFCGVPQLPVFMSWATSAV